MLFEGFELQKCAVGGDPPVNKRSQHLSHKLWTGVSVILRDAEDTEAM